MHLIQGEGLGKREMVCLLTLALKGGSQELARHLVYPISDPSVRDIVSKNRWREEGETVAVGLGLRVVQSAPAPLHTLFLLHESLQLQYQNRRRITVSARASEPKLRSVEQH